MSSGIRIASSIIVANSSFELLFVKRASTLQWANAFVWPGGVRESSDGDDDRVCAIRELFEETGLLFDSNGFALQLASRDQWRKRVHDDATQFDALLKEMKLRAPIDSVKPLAHWTTPREESIRKRFDTRFFFVKLHGSDQRHGLAADLSESSQMEWITPSNALSMFDQRLISLAPPTWFILRQLSQFQTVDHVLRACDRMKRVEHIAPSIAINDDSLPFVAMPGDEANAETENPDVALASRAGQRRRIVMRSDPDKPASRSYTYECNVGALRNFPLDSFTAMNTSPKL